MKRLLITSALSVMIALSFAQGKTSNTLSDESKRQIIQEREAVAAKPLNSVQGNTIRERVRERNESAGERNVSDAERLRAFEAMKKTQSGKASLLESQQAKERSGAATLTPEQNAARIAKMEEYREAMRAREKANAEKLGVQPPTSMPAQLQRQAPRPPSTIENSGRNNR